MAEHESTPAVRTHLECPDCGSHNMAQYADGGTYCFSANCGKATKGDGDVEEPSQVSKTSKKVSVPPGISFTGIPGRKITAATCKKWGYGTRAGNHYALYRDADGTLTGVKKRTPEKDFPWQGAKSKKAPLWGQHLWSNKKGKMIVVTEGEIDALTVSQCFANEWPVVSLSGGAGSVRRDITQSLEWLMRFEKVVLWFDNDEAGNKAIEEATKILPVGLAYQVKSNHKDASEMLLAEGPKAVTRACHAAEEISIGGLISLDDMIDNDLLERPEMGIAWSHDFLTNWTYGRRFGEVYTFGAGTGVGKSAFLLQEIAYTLNTIGHNCALFSFENGKSMTGRQILGKLVGKILHKPDSSDEFLQKAKDIYRKGKGKLYINDMRGSTDWEEVKPVIRAWVLSKGIKHVVLDNLTALADTSRERESLEQIMKETTALADELDICIYLVSHLATPKEGSHEEGARVTIRQFKGSRSIGFWSFFMFGMERDQQEGGATTFRCLKDRFTGESTGNTQLIDYDVDSGLYSPASGIDPVMEATLEETAKQQEAF